MSILQTKGLIKEYKSGEGVVRAVNDINIGIGAGEFVAIVGPLGSGKSTLLYLMGLLEQPTSGAVLFKGEDLNRHSNSRQTDFRRNQVGFVFQHYTLLPMLNALENVKVPMIPYTTGFNLNERANELLDLVGLSHRARHLPSQLSGVEQQLVAIARALLSKPELILADEPTGNLDSKNGGQVMELLGEMRSQLGLTLVLVTRDEQIPRQADRVIRLKDGAVVDHGKVRSG